MPNVEQYVVIKYDTIKKEYVVKIIVIIREENDETIYQGSFLCRLFGSYQKFFNPDRKDEDCISFEIINKTLWVLKLWWKQEKGIYDFLKKNEIIIKYSIQYLEEKCKEIEDFQSRYVSFNLRRTVKEITDSKRQNPDTSVLHRNENTMRETDLKIKLWKEYIEELLNGEREVIEHIANTSIETGPKYYKRDIVCIKNHKEQKSPGPDELPIDNKDYRRQAYGYFDKAL